MSFFNNRTIALLICFLALVACVHAHPNGSDGFDDVDYWTWLSSMGTQFTDMVANDHFAQMTMNPMPGSNPPPCPQPQSQPRSEPSHPRYIQPSNGYFPPWGMGSMGGEGSYSPMNSQPAGSYEHAAQFQQQVESTRNGLESVADGKRPSWKMFHRHTSPEVVPHQVHMAQQPQAFTEAVSMSAPAFVDNQYPVNSQIQYQGWPVGQQPLGHTVDQFNLQAYNMAPLQAPQPIPASFPMPTTQIHPPLSRSAPNVPEILSTDVTSNFNYQPGMPKSTVGNMLGWIGRAPTTGDRAVPRLDTNYLVPPEAKSANHSPSTASTTPSSARLRRKPWQMVTGDFICGYCKAGFPTQGDLTHHLRSHAPYMSRQHVCQHCEKRFQYRKDLLRHLPKHDPNRKKFYCPFSGCKYHSKGFGRQDHLDRHMGSQHRIDTPQQASRASSSF